MLSDEMFYSKFRNWVIGMDDIEEEGKRQNVGNNREEQGDEGNGEDNDAGDVVQRLQRIAFLLHQVDIIPMDVRNMYCNLMRCRPTAPLYLLLALGTLGRNIARYSGVRRRSAHKNNVIRSGCFYKFLAPSRFGKGIAMSFLTELGGHVEAIRVEG